MRTKLTVPESLRSRRSVAWLASAAMTAALATALLSAGSASASTTPGTALTAAAVTAATVTPGTEDATAGDSLTTSLQTSGTDLAGNSDVISAAGVSCATLTVHAYNWDVVGIHLANYYMYTYWCWNGAKVTSHTTWENGSVTTTGAATGWEYEGVIESSFNCYYANSNKCSGNHETSEGKFQACIIKIGCYSSWYPYIQEFETYNGGWSYSYSS